MYFVHKTHWECIVKVFRKLYMKYKINPMNSYWDITIQKNFNQKLQNKIFLKKNLSLKTLKLENIRNVLLRSLTKSDGRTLSRSDGRKSEPLCLHHYRGSTKVWLKFYQPTLWTQKWFPEFERQWGLSLKQMIHQNNKTTCFLTISI